MAAVLEWANDDIEACCPEQKIYRPVGGLPPSVESALWRGTEMGSKVTSVLSSGFVDLDRELPGGGWPCHSLTEILSPQPSVLEWRLLGPVLRKVVADGGCVVVVGPPKTPHLPGLRHIGIDERHLVWVQAEAPAQRLWCTEQLLKANACGALIAWLPQARPEQIRRLEVCSQGCDSPVFLFRPAAAQHEASAAPLRVMASFGLDWELQVQVFKRRGPVHEGCVRLASVPGGLSSILTPRLQSPSQLVSSRISSCTSVEVPANALGGALAHTRPQHHATVQ